MLLKLQGEDRAFSFLFFFADNILIFAKAQAKGVRVIMNVLKEFEMALGLKGNVSRRHLVPRIFQEVNVTTSWQLLLLAFVSV